MQIVATLYDSTEIQRFKEVGVQGVLLPIKGFSTGTNHRFEVSELGGILEVLRQQELFAYLLLNTIIHESDLPALEQVVKSLQEYSFEAVVCYDFTVGIMMEKYRMQDRVIYQPGTQNTNMYDPHYFYKLGIKGVTLSREITLSDLLLIMQSAPDIELSLVGHGYLPMFYSARKLLSLYQDYKFQARDLHHREDLTIEEEIRPGLEYPIFEDEHGCLIYRPIPLESFRELMVLKPYLDQFFVERSFLSDEAYFDALEVYAGKQSFEFFQTKHPHYDSGFYYKKTNLIKGVVE